MPRKIRYKERDGIVPEYQGSGSLWGCAFFAVGLVWLVPALLIVWIIAAGNSPCPGNGEESWWCGGQWTSGEIVFCVLCPAFGVELMALPLLARLHRPGLLERILLVVAAATGLVFLLKVLAATEVVEVILFGSLAAASLFLPVWISLAVAVRRVWVIAQARRQGT